MEWKSVHTALVIMGVFVLALAIGLFAWGCPQYQVWQQGLMGKAELAKAEWNRQITIREAAAKKESATMLAEAEIERAKGVAEANKIIGESLQGHEEYLRYLWIHGLENNAIGTQVIYVPTEAGLPILEAQRLSMGQAFRSYMESGQKP